MVLPAPMMSGRRSACGGEVAGEPAQRVEQGLGLIRAGVGVPEQLIELGHEGAGVGLGVVHGRAEGAAGGAYRVRSAGDDVPVAHALEAALTQARPEAGSVKAY